MIKHYLHQINGKNVIYRFSAENRECKGRGSCFVIRGHSCKNMKWQHNITHWVDANGWIYIPRSKARKLMNAARLRRK